MRKNFEKKKKEQKKIHFLNVSKKVRISKKLPIKKDGYINLGQINNIPQGKVQKKKIKKISHVSYSPSSFSLHLKYLNGDDIENRNECQRSITRRNNIRQSRLTFLTSLNCLAATFGSLIGSPFLPCLNIFIKCSVNGGLNSRTTA